MPEQRGPEGPLAPKYLADHLTLFQPGRADYAHILLHLQCFLPSSFTVSSAASQQLLPPSSNFLNPGKTEVLSVLPLFLSSVLIPNIHLYSPFLISKPIFHTERLNVTNFHAWLMWATTIFAALVLVVELRWQSYKSPLKWQITCQWCAPFFEKIKCPLKKKFH